MKWNRYFRPSMALSLTMLAGRFDSLHVFDFDNLETKEFAKDIKFFSDKTINLFPK